MARIIVTTDPNELRDAPLKKARMSGTRPLTRRQSRGIENLSAGRNVVSVRDGLPFVRQPDGLAHLGVWRPLRALGATRESRGLPKHLPALSRRLALRASPLVKSLSGVRMFSREELTRALATPGLTDVRQRVSGLAQFVAARKPAP